MKFFLEGSMFTLIVILIFKSKHLEREEDVFSYATTNSMRGVAMLGIILHHIKNSLGVSSFFLGSMGYLGTSVFFFISGYGNELSLTKLDNITFKWFWKKLKKIYFPYVFCYVLWVIYYFYENRVIKFKEMLEDVLTISLPDMINWFPKVILLCFILHWVCVKYVNKIKFRLIILTMFNIMYIVVLKSIHVPDYWYLSVSCYL